MIKYKCKKLWGGKVSVRSCVVDYARRTGQSIEVEFNGQKMVINNKSAYEVTAPPQTAQRTDRYMKKGESYQLYDFLWQPKIEINDWTNEGRSKLLSAWNKIKNKQFGLG